MNKESYIKLNDNQSIVLNNYIDGMSLSVHIMGGHTTVFLDKNEVLEVLKAIKTIMGDNTDN